MLACEDIQALTLHPSVFVWAPDLLFPGLNIKCPSCGSQFSSTQWHTPRLLHGLSSLQAYVTRRYMCCRCAPDGSQARQRCKQFLADTPTMLDALPDHVKSLWQFCCTGRTLCSVTLVDFIRTMATKVSWSAIADSVNEVRQTSWARDVTLPYYRLCARFNISAGNGAPALPDAFRVKEKWLRSLYMADESKRRQEVRDELNAETGDDVLVLDWTRDAASRCSREWLFNVMDGQHVVLCSEFTTACEPKGVKGILERLCKQGVKPKVVYVDEECCGAWPQVISTVWPDAVVRLDGMHAIRRLTRTTSSTQHPWHGGFCAAVSRAIYTSNDQTVQTGDSASAPPGTTMPASGTVRRGVRDPWPPRGYTGALASA